MIMFRMSISFEGKYPVTKEQNWHVSSSNMSSSNKRRKQYIIKYNNNKRMMGIKMCKM